MPHSSHLSVEWDFAGAVCHLTTLLIEKRKSGQSARRLVRGSAFATLSPMRGVFIQFAVLFGAVLLFVPIARAQPSTSFTAAGSGDLNYKQFGELAIQDGGRRKPVDTFARESLIRITGRSVYT